MNFKTSPLPHQQAAFERFKDAAYFGLFWPMGRGKTKTVIDIAAYKFERREIANVVVCAPNYVHAQWVTEQVPMHCPVPYTAFTYKTSSAKKYARALQQFLRDCKEDDTRLHWFAVHIDAFSYDGIDEWLSQFCIPGKTLWVLDEATRIKNPKVKRSKHLCNTRRMFGGPAVALTGSALAKRPTDAWNICRFLSPAILPVSYTAFEAAHTVMMHRKCKTRTGQLTDVAAPIDRAQWDKVKQLLGASWHPSVGYKEALDVIYTVAQRCNMSPVDVKFIAETPEFVRYRNVDKLKEVLSKDFSFIDPKDDIELPPRVYKTITMPLSVEQENLLKQLKKHAVAVYGNEILSVQNAAALQMKALQICGGFFSPGFDESGKPVEPTPLAGHNAKLAFLLEAVEDLGDDQFLVFAAFTKEIQMLTRELGKLCPVRAVYGETPLGERDTIVQDFKDGKIQGLVGNAVVAGYGLNLQNALIQYWYSRNYFTEARLQAEARSHRIGTKSSPLYVDLVYDCAFEKAVLANNKEGRALNDYFSGMRADDVFKI